MCTNAIYTVTVIVLQLNFLYTVHVWSVDFRKASYCTFEPTSRLFARILLT